MDNSKVIVFALCTILTTVHGMSYIEALRRRLTPTNITTRVVFHETSILVYYIPKTTEFYLLVEGGECYLSGSLAIGTKEVYKSAVEVVQDQVKRQRDNIFDERDGVLEPEDLYHIKLNATVPGTKGRTIVGFTAVKPSKESQYKFLPFCLEDFYYIFQLISLPRITDAAATEILPVGLTVPPNCFQNTSYLHIIRHIGQHVNELDIHTQNILMTALFLYVSFNPMWHMEEKYEICTTDYRVHRDAPFLLERCCQVQRKHIFQLDREDHNIWCHQASKARYVLGDVVVTICFVATLFAPLLIKFIPSTDMPEPDLSRKDSTKEPPREPRESLYEVIKETEEQSEEPPEESNQSQISGSEEDRQTHDEIPLDSDSLEEDQVTVSPSEPLNRESADIECGQSSLSQASSVEEAVVTSDEQPSTTKWVYLDTDPVHHFTMSMFKSRGLCQCSSHGLSVFLLRFVSIYTLWVLTWAMAFITYIFYDSVFSHPILALQRIILREMFRPTYLDYVTFMVYGSADAYGYFRQLFRIMLAFVPLLITVLTMGTLFAVLLQLKPIAQTLYWKNQCKVLGVKIACKQDSELELPIKESSSHQSRSGRKPQLYVYRNMVHNIWHLKEIGFWLVLWNNFACRYSPSFRIGKGQRPPEHEQVPMARKVIQVVTIILIFPFLSLIILVHTLPVCSVLTNLFLNPKTVLVPKILQSGDERRTLKVLLLAFPVTLIGVLIFYVVLFDFTILYGHFFIFSMVDVLRNSDTTLSKIIFAVSVLVYIRQAFVHFEDQYRILKGKTFAIAKELDEKHEQNGQRLVLKSDKKSVLLKSSGQDLAMPKVIFDDVCHKIKPIRPNVTQTLMKLVASLTLILILFLIAVEYQIFHEFTLIGETILTILTVSIPRLMGLLQSEGYMELKQMKLDHDIEVIIMEHVLKERMAEPGAASEEPHIPNLRETVL